jgi:hypothetical protein
MKRNLLLGIAATLGFVLCHYDLFILPRKTFSHDTLCFYPVFAYLYDGLRHGELPLWTPYVNTGEPFYFCAAMLRLFDPMTLLAGLTAREIPLLTLYHFEILRRLVFYSLGVALLAGRLTRHRLVPPIAYTISLFSSLSPGSFRQHGFILAAYTVPWTLYFFHRLTQYCSARSLRGKG